MSEFVLLAGGPVRDGVFSDLATRVARLRQRGVVPTLATLLVGDDEASQAYVRNKMAAASKLGIEARLERLPAQAGQAEVLRRIRAWNEDARVHGILVQLPLPPGYETARIQTEVSPTKDVDGFHPLNMGCLALKGFQPLFVPCTPAGIMELLRYYAIPVAGARAVVMGRSNIVGTPMSLLLTKADATVTVVHTKSRDLPSICREADLLVVAVGKPGFVRAEMVKPGAVVVDVGIHRVGDRIVGDVAFEEVKAAASALTPVPGGVGPLTVAMLMRNVVEAAERQGG